MTDAQNETGKSDIIAQIANLSRIELQSLISDLLADSDLHDKVLRRLSSHVKPTYSVKPTKKKVFDISKYVLKLLSD